MTPALGDTPEATIIPGRPRRLDIANVASAQLTGLDGDSELGYTIRLAGVLKINGGAVDRVMTVRPTGFAAGFFTNVEQSAHADPGNLNTYNDATTGLMRGTGYGMVIASTLYVQDCVITARMDFGAARQFAGQAVRGAHTEFSAINNQANQMVGHIRSTSKWEDVATNVLDLTFDAGGGLFAGVALVTPWYSK